MLTYCVSALKELFSSYFDGHKVYYAINEDYDNYQQNIDRYLKLNLENILYGEPNPIYTSERLTLPLMFLSLVGFRYNESTSMQQQQTKGLGHTDILKRTFREGKMVSTKNTYSLRYYSFTNRDADDFLRRMTFFPKSVDVQVMFKNEPKIIECPIYITDFSAPSTSYMIGAKKRFYTAQIGFELDAYAIDVLDIPTIQMIDIRQYIPYDDGTNQLLKEDIITA